MLEQQLEVITKQNEQIIGLLQVISANTAKKKAPAKTKATKQAEEAAAAQADLQVVGNVPTELPLAQTVQAAPALVAPQQVAQVVNTPLPVSQVPVPAAPVAPAPVAAPQMTAHDIQQAMMPLVQTEPGEQAVRAIFAKYGAAKIPDIQPQYMNAVHQELKAAAGA